MLPIMRQMSQKKSMKSMKPFLRGLLLMTACCGLFLGAATPGPAFTPDEQSRIQRYAAQFKAIRTQAQLLAAYQQAMLLRQTLAPRLEAYMQGLLNRDVYPSDAELLALTARLPGLEAGLVAEGTNMVLGEDFAAFAKAAARTPEKADDAFFALMKQAYGVSFSGYGEWFSMTWDYGGCTKLGTGLHKRLFQGVHALRAARNPFGPQLTALEQELLGDLQHSNSFCRPKAQALLEFQQLIPLAPAAARPKLQLRLKYLKSGKAPKDERAFEFDCDGKGKCGYGA